MLNIVSCRQKDKQPPTGHKSKTTKSIHDTIVSDTTGIPDIQRLLPVLYHQRSGEYRALCYQSFQLARMLLMNDLHDENVISKRAIILDVDETVLDNSQYEAWCLLHGYDYNKEWDQWCTKAQAPALAGAVEFLNFVRRYGVDIFYITNRTEEVKQATAENIRKAGLPLKSDEFLIMKQDDSNKESRRKQLEERYHIALLIGDNLNDFSGVFYKRSADDRIKVTDSLHSQFGSRFVVLPNVMYGDWEKALTGYQTGLSPQEEIQIKYNRLKPAN